MVELPILVLLLLFGCSRVRSFEQKNLYFPDKTLRGTPADIGLDYRNLEVTTDSGNTIHGWIVTAEPSRGTLLFCHGNAGNISDRLKSIKVFHDLGMTVVIFDYPGYGQSTGKPHESNLYESAEAVCMSLESEFDMGRVIIFGRSLGGAVAIELATRVPAACLIVESAFTNTVNIGRELFPILPVKLMLSQHFDSLAKVPTITMPKLFIHSRNDDIIPYRHGVDLYKAAAQPKDFMEITGSHNDGFLATGRDYTDGIEKFLYKTLESKM